VEYRTSYFLSLQFVFLFPRKRQVLTRPPPPVFCAASNHADDDVMTSYSYAGKFTETFRTVGRFLRGNFCLVIVHVRILGSLLTKLSYLNAFQNTALHLWRRLHVNLLSIEQPDPALLQKRKLYAQTSMLQILDLHKSNSCTVVCLFCFFGLYDDNIML
jgi:hypothetical protein